MRKLNIIQKILLISSLSCSTASVLAVNNQYRDYRSNQLSSDELKMQDFHLSNAKSKIQNQQPSYAWGDLSFILCHIPNHHEALKQMSELASQLHKEAELIAYYDRAIALYPQDEALSKLYDKFLNQKPTIEYLSKNNLTDRQ